MKNPARRLLNLTKRRALMIFRKIQVLAVAMVLSTLLLASDVAKPKPTFTFQGCWTQSISGTCRDIFLDDQGNYWICKDCGTTGNPGPGKCNQISQATLASGFWCS
jgi:hypothetical protein